MTDFYLNIVNKPFIKDSVVGSFLKSLSLPRPVPLRRDKGPLEAHSNVLLIGKGSHAQFICKLLTSWGMKDASVHNNTKNLDANSHLASKPIQDLNAIVIVFDENMTVASLEEIMTDVSSALKRLTEHSRVIFVYRDRSFQHDHSTQENDVQSRYEEAAVTKSVEGIIRSLAQEMRSGSTVNGIRLEPYVHENAASVCGSLRFLLSGVSAFIDGQTISVSNNSGSFAVNLKKPLEGKVAVVTGAARGIGAAIVQALAEKGAYVIGVDLPSVSDKLTQVINKAGGSALQLDITDINAAQNLVNFAMNHRGRLDIIVHNAGITRDKLLVNMTQEQFNDVVNINLVAQMRINKYLANKGFLDKIHRIISVSSISGIGGNKGQTNYSASKAGIIGYTAAFAEIMKNHHGTINAVAPGFIESEMTAKMPAVNREVARRLNSLQQGGLPSDVAQTVAFLAADYAGGINGQTIRVCGQNILGA